MPHRRLLTDLPPDVIAGEIAARLDLVSYLHLTQASSSIRAACLELQPATTIIKRMLDEEEHDHLDSPDSASTSSRRAEWRILATWARRTAILPLSTSLATLYAHHLLPRSRRSFVLDQLEPPLLSDRSWKDAYARRFPAEAVERAQKSDKNLTWRALFWRELRQIDHIYETSCTRTSTTITYFNLYRHNRLTVNRISPHQLNHQTIFHNMKVEVSLSQHRTRGVTLLTHPDIRVWMLYCSDEKPDDHYQANPLATELVRAIERQGGAVKGVNLSPMPDSHLVLGPSLIVATIAPGRMSFDGSEQDSSGKLAYHDVSFEALVKALPQLRRLVPAGPERFMGYV